VEAARLTAGVVVQPDALAEQDRCDVEVDLVDQSVPAADGRWSARILRGSCRRPQGLKLCALIAFSYVLSVFPLSNKPFSTGRMSIM